MKHAPFPLLIHSAPMSPLWLFTIWRHTASPMPCPLDFVVKNGVKRFSLVSWVKPSPLSVTDTMSHRLSSDSVAVTLTSVAVVSSAFFNRLRNTCSICVRSTLILASVHCTLKLTLHLSFICEFMRFCNPIISSYTFTF